MSAQMIATPRLSNLRLRRRDRRLKMFCLALLCVGSAVLLAKNAHADCVDVDADNTKCEGSFPNGINLSPSAHPFVTVENLTEGILNDTLGFVWNTGPGRDGRSLTFDIGSLSVDAPDALFIFSNGGTGQSVKDLFATVSGNFISSSQINGNAGAPHGVMHLQSVGGGGSTSSGSNTGGSGGVAGDIQLIFSGSMTGTDLAGIVLGSFGGAGGLGGTCDFLCNGGQGGASRPSGDISLATGGTITVHVTGTNAAGIDLFSRGGDGGSGGFGAIAGGSGSNASRSGNIAISDTLFGGSIWSVSTAGDDSPGFRVHTVGGRGGNGGNGGAGNGEPGGQGGVGGDISFTGAGATVSTSGDESPGFFALSEGGAGGNGGSTGSDAGGQPGKGAAGGVGGAVTLQGLWSIATEGGDSDGLSLSSIGGAGGRGGDGTYYATNAPGGGSGNAGSVELHLGSGSSVATEGDNSVAIAAQSLGGRGGTGGSATGVVAFAASGGSGGVAGPVTITTTAGSGLGEAPGANQLLTTGNGSPAILGQAIGGGGGHGGAALGSFYSQGGIGSVGGPGNTVDIVNAFLLTTEGHDSAGIVAQSIGGTGGNGGSSTSITALGGRAAAGGNGSAVTVTNSGAIETGRTPGLGADPTVSSCELGCSPGIVAQSIGGGGGNGGASTGWFSIGGRAAGGGAGGTVTVNNAAGIDTHLDDSTGILAQSVGGGGGNGGASVSLGAGTSVAIGGGGGPGGNGDAVSVTTSPSATSNLTTVGASSHGVHAHSIGGGGGNAGFSASTAASAGSFPAVSVSLGGTGGGGGGAGTADISAFSSTAPSSPASIQTAGDGSIGLFAQSIGGGGGNGGLSVAISAATSGAISLGLGGSGGTGGAGQRASVASQANITTSGSAAPAIRAQSIGGGGGNGGMSIASSLSTSVQMPSITFAFGGAGRSGNTAGRALVRSDGVVSTQGTDSPGLVAQSIGGGGGSGALGVAANLTLTGGTGLDFAIGGPAASGGASRIPANSFTVQVQTFGGTVTTGGNQSPGILAQSIGGGGGSGGLSVDGSLATAQSTDLGGSIGGQGGSGADAGTVIAKLEGGPVRTSGDHSEGILAQSVGGGGGVGGSSFTGSLSTSNSSSLAFSLGGAGDSGGSGADVEVYADQAVTTSGQQSGGVVAQSIGGGGGSGGSSIAATLSTSSSRALSASIGGRGASGGTGGTVAVHIAAPIDTAGAQSDAVFAQSIGGSGGRGGTSVTGAIATSQSTDIGVAVGGGANSGGDAAGVVVTTGGSGITATGDGSRGIVAQSIGGGGGHGGMAITGAFTNANTTKDLSVGVGGGGGTGGAGGAVSVTSRARIETGSTSDPLVSLSGEYGILAQSIGGGGGSGGLSASAGTNRGNRSLTVSVGGGGGSGSTASSVTVESNAGISTAGAASDAILAQSIAGGGGAGGGTATFGLTSKTAKGFGVSVGGTGASGAAAGQVTVTLSGGTSAGIVTSGLGSRGVVAQSIGGGGGSGGANLYRNQSGTQVPDQLAVGVGGSGGAGGKGGTVILNSDGLDVTTGAGLPNTFDAGTGAQGHGILLQSIGGGGGDASAGIHGDIKPAATNGAIDVGVGGKGNTAGDAGNVSAGTNAPLAGSVLTRDYNSYGLLAQSIGGGGGSGAAGVEGDVKNNAGKGLTLGIGGSGGAGGRAGVVTIDSALAITVEGSGSKGLVAQSIGGGGGAGSQGILGNVSGASDDNTKQMTLGVGGDGGAAGGGRTVSVVNSGRISTGSSASGDSVFTGNDAIFAQSVGGGGGIGGIGIQGNVGNSTKAEAVSVTIGAGGSGGSSGAGSTVTVTNTGALSAAGSGARGILAHSIGGGGGTAGGGILGNITAPSDASADKQLELGIGGAAGGGGDGGQVTVVNHGAITMSAAPVGTASADQMAGIHAQSIGGGGGVGGIGITGDITGSKTSKAVDLAIGGSGGSGGDAAAGSVVSSASDFAQAGVGVSNSGTITTVGDGSVGILAQSIGGGGGAGAVGLSGKVDSGGGKALSLAIGGSGGDGGKGDTVAVANTGSIMTGTADTTDDPVISQAHGIVAQSIGGGGGIGMHTGSLIYGSTSSDGTEHGVDVTIGSAAQGGQGGVVFLSTGTNRTNTITTFNRASHGVVAQSIGGGGGLAGDLGGIGTEDASDQWAASVAIGARGAGNQSMDGGQVTLEHDAALVSTHGDGSIGLLAQSVGGGGGAGGDAVGLESTGNASQTTKNAQLAINLGGSGGAAGSGGDVNLTSRGRVTTDGIGAPAIFAQSVSMGGGIGGLGANGVSGRVTLGGSSDLEIADAGDVTVTSTGDIATGFGAGGPVIASHGIVAQSVGGGGGYAGTVQLTYPDFQPVPEGSNPGNDFNTDAGLGNGGKVVVNAAGTIRTTGGSSVGILAQSVGGGGGIAGRARDAIYDDGWLGARIGGNRGYGYAGDVVVKFGNTASDTIHTSGVAAHGIFAQGSSTGFQSGVPLPTVDVTVAGTVLTSGVGSFGVFAQGARTRDDEEAGPVTVTITGTGSVSGGATSTDPQRTPLTGAGVVILGGTTSNRLVNAGALDAVSGIAAYIEQGTIDNSGTIHGKVCSTLSCARGSSGIALAEAPHPVTLINQASGVINAGERLDVTRVVNRGVISPAGVGSVGTARVTGDLIQEDGGVFVIDLDPAATAENLIVDFTQIGGAAEIDGGFEINLLSTFQPGEGRQFANLIAAEGGLAADGAAVRRSAVAQYELDNSNEALQLSYDIDFAHSGLSALTNDNQDELVRHLQGFYKAGALDEDIARALILIENPDDYAEIVNTMSAELVVDNEISSLFSGLHFEDSLLDCGTTGRSRDVEDNDDGRCVFVSIDGRQRDFDRTSDNLGFDENAYGVTAGWQSVIGKSWKLGGAFAYERRDLSADSALASSDGDQFYVGFTAKRRLSGDVELSGSATVGYGDFELKRYPIGLFEVSGSQERWSAGAQVRADYLVDLSSWYVKPRVDLGLTHFWDSSFTESAPSGLGLDVDSSSETYVNVQPAIEIGSEIHASNGVTVRPRFDVGVTWFPSGGEPSTEVRFTYAPDEVESFHTATEIDEVRFDVAAGVDVYTRSNVAVRFGIYGNSSSNITDYGAGLRVDIPL